MSGLPLISLTCAQITPLDGRRQRRYFRGNEILTKSWPNQRKNRDDPI